MAERRPASIARMRKPHSAAKMAEATAEQGRQVVEQQSLRDALVAGVIVIVIFSVLWAMLSTLINRIFPWMTVVLGILIGLAIRRAGRGIDWRFPTLAGALAIVGALISNVVVSAAFTARALETTTFDVLRAVTAMTWPVYFREVVIPADIIFAFVAAGVAAFYANRRLDRTEFLAIRKWQQQQAGR